jgi:hypothetical protein
MFVHRQQGGGTMGVAMYLKVDVKTSSTRWLHPTQDAACNRHPLQSLQHLYRNAALTAATVRLYNNALTRVWALMVESQNGV